MQLADVRQHKYLLLFVLAGFALAIIVLGVAGSLLTTIDERLKNDAELQVKVMTERASYNAADHIYLIEHAIESFTVQTADLDAITPALVNLKNSFSFQEVAFIDSQGNGRTADGLPFTEENISSTEVIKSENGVIYRSPFHTTSDDYVYQICKPISVGGVEIGTVYVNVPIDMLISKKQFRIFSGEGYFILFEAKTGMIVMQPAETDLPLLEEGTSLYDFLATAQENDEDAPLLSNGRTPLEQGEVTRVQEAVANGETYLFLTMIDGKSCYVCVAPVGVAGAYVCSVIPEDNVRSEASTVATTFEVVFGIVFVCLIAMLVMSFIIYRKRMEEKGVEMKTHLYGALSDSLDMAVNMYSAEDAVVTPIVAKAREIIGYPMAEFMSNKRIADKIELSEPGRDMLARMRDGEVVSLEQGEFSLRDRSTGEPRWVTYTVTPFLYEDKRQLLVVFRDSTAEKNLQLSMREAMVAAETANHAKSDFLSRMSHEIRTPMNAIIGMTQIVQKHLDEPQKVESSLKKINMASEHLLNLINDVLDISKIESGKMMLVFETFTLTELIENVILVINAQCELKNQEFKINKESVFEENFFGDRIRLQQVLINLLSNSVKYTPTEGHISLTIMQKQCTIEKYVQLTFVIKDDGIGMTKEYQNHIFEPFVMEGRTTSQGTGLGMPIVKNIVTMMNGEIHVDSEVDKGTIFTVVITLERAQMDGAGARVDKGHTEPVHAESVHTESVHADDALPLEQTQDPAPVSNPDERSTIPASDSTAIKQDEDACDAKAEAQLQPEADPHKADAHKADSHKVDPHDQDEKPIDFSTIRVLLAEDNELNAEIARELLSDSGFKIDWAQNGKQACTMFQDSEVGFYDVILMDIQMPVMDGYAATECIRALDRADAKKVSIIAMSANAFMEDVQASLRCGMNAHLSKPIDVRLVLKTIDEQMRKRF